MAQTELHRHLDVSLRIETLLELAQKRGLEGESTSLQAFREKVVMTRPLPDLATVLARFTLFQKVFESPSVLDRIAFEVVEDCWREGTRKAELRFSPGFVCEESGLHWEDALAGFEAGMKGALLKYPGMKAGLICIATRDQGVEMADRTVEFYLKHQSRFIGLDLAGNEKEFPCRLFERSFQKAIKAGSKITIHAGEAAGPENIWEAIELLGAQRIGHGVSCVKDPKLMDYLRKKQICLEMCPTSNWLTQAVLDLSQHPLKQVLRAGIPVCINTDDPSVFGVGIPQEIQVCREKIGLSTAEVEKCFDYAEKASFLP